MQYLAESFNEMAAGIDRLLIDEKEKQRLEEELRIARSIQLKLLPAESFQTDEFEIAAANIPATEIAGDYFDYFYQPGNSLSIFVADVSGKGASAAFYMAELKGVINHLQREVMAPASLIGECHDSMKNSLDKATFITMNMALFRIPEKKFRLARAGHTQAIFFNAKENKCSEIYPEGVAIGLINFTREKIKEIELPYQKGDILFLFSDGLSEIMNENDEVLGVDQLRRLIAKNHSLSAEDIKQRVLDFSIQFSESGISRDDLTFIVLKVK
jgi:serine phosphatase RsbU (regulator of sigma subunit)